MLKQLLDRLNQIEARPEMWGTGIAVELQYIAFLDMVVGLYTGKLGHMYDDTHVWKNYLEYSKIYGLGAITVGCAVDRTIEGKKCYLEDSWSYKELIDHLKQFRKLTLDTLNKGLQDGR